MQQGDGYCDDENNICGCDWDGGDCCEGLLTYCTECQCRDPDIGECYSICGVDAWFGDFVCDDEVISTDLLCNNIKNENTVNKMSLYVCVCVL